MGETPEEVHRLATPGVRRAIQAMPPSATEGRSRRKPGTGDRPDLILVAAIISIADDEPVVEIISQRSGNDVDLLPSTAFKSSNTDTLEQCLRVAIIQQTGHSVGYLQQLIAFIRRAPAEDVLIGYLAMVHDTRRGVRAAAAGRFRSRQSRWQGCYLHLPWEDWRTGRPPIIDDVIIPRLTDWARSAAPPPRKGASSKAAVARQQAERTARIRLAFSSPGASWDEEKVLTRFELLVEAGLIQEELYPDRGTKTEPKPPLQLGRAMAKGHRRILAAGLGRLRSDLKARPVVFELMDEEFSLYDLQRTVEVVLGPNLHKQNFRRLIETAGLVEPTGGMKSHTGGRPAKLYRFRRDVLLERPSPGLKMGN